MNIHYDIPAPRIIAMGIKVEAIPRPGLSVRDLLPHMEQINDIRDASDSSILLVEETYPISYSPTTDFEDRELIWKCDHCNAFSRSKEVIEQHERTDHARANPDPPSR